MVVFEKFKNKNIDELAEWLDENCSFDTAPWWRWWDENYCNKCEPEIEYTPDWYRRREYAWCELNGKCRFFKEMDDIPDSKQIIKMWLLSEEDESIIWDDEDIK